jgi:PAS domain S-box-containing protein
MPRSRHNLPVISAEGMDASRIVGDLGGVGWDCSPLLETMMDGFAYCQMIYDTHGQPMDWIYLAVNPAFARLTGLVDIVGKTATEAIPGFKDSSAELLEIYGRVASGQGPEAFELAFHPLSMWVHLAVSSPAPGYFFAVFEDITERKKLEATLQLSQLSLDRSADMIHWVRPDGHIAYTSDSSVSRTGYSREEFLSLTIFDLDPAMNPEAWAAHWRELKSSGSLSFETVHVTKGGEVFPVEVTANYLELDGEEYNFAFTRDMSQSAKRVVGLDK